MPRKRKEKSDNYFNPFPTALRRIMEERGTTQDELANFLGVTRQSISCYCGGDTSPTIETLVKIADYFNVSVDWLLRNEGDPARKPTAVDELGLSPSLIRKIKQSRELALKYEWNTDNISDEEIKAMSYLSDEEIMKILESKAGKPDFSSCDCTHGAFNLLSEATVDSPIYAIIASISKKIRRIPVNKVPAELQASARMKERFGEKADYEVMSAMLACEIYNKYPEWAGFFHVCSIEQSLEMEIDLICKMFRESVEEITGYKKFKDNRKL